MAENDGRKRRHGNSRLSSQEERIKCFKCNKTDVYVQVTKPSRRSNNYNESRGGGQVVVSREEVGADGCVNTTSDFNNGEGCLLPVSNHRLFISMTTSVP